MEEIDKNIRKRYTFSLSQLQRELLKYFINNTDGKQREQIVEDLHFPRTTVYDNINRINDYSADLIHIKKTFNSKRGRPPVFFYVDAKDKEKASRLLHLDEI